MTDKLRIDQDSLTFRELVAIEEQLGAPLSVLFDQSQAKPMAALAWIMRRRDEPAYTFDQALDDYGPGQVELVAPDPEVPGANNGAAPAMSPGSGA